MVTWSPATWSPEAMGKDPHRRILTLPNLVSLTRLAGVGWFLWLLLAEERVLVATIVFAVIGATDWVDGALARALDQESEFGRILDPVADRLALASAVIGGTIAGLVPVVLTVTLVTREVVMLGAAGYLLVRTGETLHVRWLGKAATFTLYAAVPLFFLAGADVGAEMLLPVAWIMGTLGLAVYVWVAAGYLQEIRSRVDPSKEVSK